MNKYRKLKILIVTQYFYPENFKSTDLAIELKKRGHSIDALVGIPNYPIGKFYKGYGIFKKRYEVISEIRVFRVFQTPRGSNPRGLKLALNYFSFVLSSCIWMFFFTLFKKKYDAIFVFQTSPITQAIPAILLSKLNRIPVYVWVQDLWPESLIAANIIKKDYFIFRLINILVKNIYKSSNKILVQSPLFYESIISKGSFSEKIVYIPNWAEDIYLNKVIVAPNNDIEIDKQNFNIIYTGNIGVAQDFENTIQAAIELKKYKNIHWYILGEGSKKQWLLNKALEYNISDVFHVGSGYNIKHMPYFYEKADFMLVTLKKDDIFSITIPSKIQSYLAYGKPILGMLDGIGGEIIKTSNCGFTVKAGEYKELSNIVIKAANLTNTERVKLGQNARKYYETNFDKRNIISQIEKIIYDYVT